MRLTGFCHFASAENQAQRSLLVETLCKHSERVVSLTTRLSGESLVKASMKVKPNFSHFNQEKVSRAGLCNRHLKESGACRLGFALVAVKWRKVKPARFLRCSRKACDKCSALRPSKMVAANVEQSDDRQRGIFICLSDWWCVGIEVAIT